MNKQIRMVALLLLVFAGCSRDKHARQQPVTVKTAVGDVILPAPHSKLIDFTFSKVTGWPANRLPHVPAGFKVELYAGGLVNPRNILVAPNSDVLVAESNTELTGWKKIVFKWVGYSGAQRSGASANRITLFRDSDGDGRPDQRSTYLEHLDQPYGMAIVGSSLYVACMNGVWKYPYQPGELKMSGKGQKIRGLPVGGYNNHWTRNILPNAAGTQLYVSVGSGSNIGEHGMQNEVRRANILEINLDGSGERRVAYGLRNPNGLAIDPRSGKLWTAVNERDGLGDDLVPDYITGVVEGGFYGWPYSYYGTNTDTRVKQERPDLVKKALVPDVSMGAHTACLSIVFNRGSQFSALGEGAFIAEHGSWNRSQLAGYKVVFVPFKNGRPVAAALDFATGFISSVKDKKVFGRPAGVALANDGALLIADDSGNKIWRVSR